MIDIETTSPQTSPIQPRERPVPCQDHGAQRDRYGRMTPRVMTSNPSARCDECEDKRVVRRLAALWVEL